jgi:predicted Zn finger-like uncharacterized protein
MDVTCERCGTEYEFDETLVSDRGTTVKCTNCGHLFKVFRGGGAAAAPERGAAPHDDKKTWTLRLESGASRAISSLKELQRLISEGHVGEDDELSRSGEAWKRLGDIAELSTFFAAARAAAASPPRRDPTARGIPRPPADEGRPAGRPQGKGTMMGMGGKPAATPSFGDDDPNKRTHKMAVPPPSGPTGGPSAPRPPARAPSERPPPPPAAHAATEYPDPEPRRDPTPGPGSRRDPTPHRGNGEHVQTARNAPPVAPPPERRDATPSTAPPVRPREIAPTREGSARDVPTERMPKPPAVIPPGPPRPRSNESRRDDSPDVRQARRPLSDPPPRLRVDDEDESPSRAPRRSSSGLWVGLVLLLAAGVGVALGWDRIQALLAPAEDGAGAFVAAGDEAVARDRDEGYRDAVGEYTKALALDDHDVRALVGLSRAHALLAQNRLFEASDLDARAAENPALAGEASALRREATELTSSARENAEQAVRIGSGGADAEVVLADALRLSADPLARSRLDRARTLEPTPTAEALRVDALLTVEGASLAGAVALAEQAVAEDPGLLRARILLARAHLAAGDATAARAQVQAVLTRDPEHPIARALLLRLDATGDVDAGVAVAVAPPPIPPSPPAGPASTGGSASEEAPASPSGGSGGSAPSGGSAGSGGGSRPYEVLIAQAREILDNGNPSRARTLYDQALAARPGAPEALTGLGFCLLAAGDANGALSRFRTAAATGYSEALIGLGDAYRRLGDNDRALEAYEQYLTRSPSGPHASIARRQADRLRASGAAAGGGGGGSTGGGGSEPSGGGAPETAPHELPAPTGATEPAPNDTPAIDSEP